MELNKEQIIKALECLTGEPMFCRECVYNGVGAFSCKKDLAKDALSLIKVLTAKTEAQDITISELRKSLEKATHDTDRYARKIKELIDENANLEQAYECADSARREISSRCDELTEENERLHASCTELERKCASLTEENERLRASLTNTTEAYEFVNGIVFKSRADTVRKMQERIEEHATNGYPRKVRLDVIDQIAKEMLEGG